MLRYERGAPPSSAAAKLIAEKLGETTPPTSEPCEYVCSCGLMSCAHAMNSKCENTCWKCTGPNPPLEETGWIGGAVVTHCRCDLCPCYCAASWSGATHLILEETNYLRQFTMDVAKEIVKVYHPDFKNAKGHNTILDFLRPTIKTQLSKQQKSGKRPTMEDVLIGSAQELGEIGLGPNERESIQQIVGTKQHNIVTMATNKEQAKRKRDRSLSTEISKTTTTAKKGYNNRLHHPLPIPTPSPKPPPTIQRKIPPVASIPKSSDVQWDSLFSDGSGGTFKNTCTNRRAGDKLRLECSRYLSAAMLDAENPDQQRDADLFISLSASQSWAKDLCYAHGGTVSVNVAITMLRRIADHTSTKGT